MSARQAALQEGEQQLHAEQARLAALEETLKVWPVRQTPVILTFGHPIACCLIWAIHIAGLAVMHRCAFRSSSLPLAHHQLAVPVVTACFS